jgi:type 2 lantibiotic biosynthesis protein LanM
MNATILQTPDWYRAVTLTERIASLHTSQRGTSNTKVNSELAERRQRRWRSQAPFSTDTHFAQRLATDGLSEDEFLYLLGEPIQAVQQRFAVTASWLVELDQAYPIALPEGVIDKNTASFLDAIAPLIKQGCARLQAGIQALQQAHSKLPFDPSTVEQILFVNLPSRLLWMLSRTMILELHVARLQGLLEGNTPQARFHSFVRRLSQRDVALALLQEYPVLARQIILCINQWVRFSLEFLQHLCDDWEAIRAIFSPESSPGVLVQVRGGEGDQHREGCAVMIARFSSGFQVVYKPRSLAVETHFQELLTWLNQIGAHPPFRTLKILDQGTHGWVEFVEAQGCTSQDEVRRFYQRQGGYLALLYAIEAIDFHFENLIAAGEHPLLIDLEGLFHPRVDRTGTQPLEMLAGRTMEHSVLRIGLLPWRSWANDKSDGVDLSGLGTTGGQFWPQPALYLEDVGTDKIRVARKPMPVPSGHHRPTLNGSEVNMLDYTESITTGFIQVYRLLLKHRDELLADSGPLARFAEDEVRVVLRPTQTYGRLLQESFHPNLLRDALDRDRFFDRLWVGIEQHPYLAQIIPYERQDLLRGDIPIFTTSPRSRDLWSSLKGRIADFFAEPALASVQRCLQQLSQDDLERQLWFIRSSLTALVPSGEHTAFHSYYLNDTPTAANRERLVTAARSVGNQLEKLAIPGEQGITWIGLIPPVEGGRYWSPQPLGEDLYIGVSGVTLFLAYLGMITQERRYTMLAQSALATMHRQVENIKDHKSLIGGFRGWGGVIYTLTHLGTLWNQPTLLTEAEEIVQLLPPLIKQDEQFDILNGAAGCIGSLISLYHCRPSRQTLTAAIQCGDRLIKCARPMKRGIGWGNGSAIASPLTGFSHGTAGIGWALLELAALTGEERFRKVALDAIAYERDLFSPEAGNWPHLGDNNSFWVTWCHGAPGIGLARLCSLRHLGDADTRAEIDVALKTTLAQGFGLNHSLCHGDLGNLELILQASQTFKEEPQWHALVEQRAAMILESIDKHGWLCGVPLQIATPDLMNGLAGIGYALLRLAEPARVPSVLVLAPPIPHGSTVHLGGSLSRNDSSKER